MVATEQKPIVAIQKIKEHLSMPPEKCQQITKEEKQGK